jgi:hypothetical protein
VLSGCATRTTPTALPPRGAAPPAASAPSSSAPPTSQPKQAPKVDKPLDVDALVKKPAQMCGLVPKKLLLKHGSYGKPRLQKPGNDEMLACVWRHDGSGRSAGVMLTGFADPESKGLAAKYLLAENGYWESWSETKVLGYPALDVVLKAELPQCELIIGVNDTVTLQVRASSFGDRKTACKATKAFAKAAVKTLKRAQ